MYDLLLKGGTVIDPAQGRNEKLDVAITGSVISRVASDIAAEEATKVLTYRARWWLRASSTFTPMCSSRGATPTTPTPQASGAA